MPERHIFVPTSIVTFKTGPHNISDREEMFLLYSKGVEEGRGRGINRDGIGSPWMWDIDGKTQITDPDAQRRGSWLIDRYQALGIERGLLESKRRDSAFGKVAPTQFGKTASKLVDDWLKELQQTPDYISTFNSVYPTYDIIGAQGCGNLTMNSWFMGFVNSDFTNGQPTFLYRRNEPFEGRIYSCLVKWKDKGYSIDELRFNLYTSRIMLQNSVGENDITEDIEFAVFGQQLVEKGQIEDFRKIATQFEDLRHLFRLPNINPRTDFGKIAQARRPRMLFGEPRDDDVWFGERELRSNEDLLRHALTESILLNRQYETMGASWESG